MTKVKVHEHHKKRDLLTLKEMADELYDWRNELLDERPNEQPKKAHVRESNGL
tara:strand:- start:120 stop:278 length:159 start_codon:yes stop_codon:yes gene_type:complete